MKKRKNKKDLVYYLQPDNALSFPIGPQQLIPGQTVLKIDAELIKIGEDGYAIQRLCRCGQYEPYTWEEVQQSKLPAGEELNGTVANIPTTKVCMPARTKETLKHNCPLKDEIFAEEGDK